MKAHLPGRRAFSILVGGTILCAAMAGCQESVCSEPTGTTVDAEQETRPEEYAPCFTVESFASSLPVLVIDTAGDTILNDPKIDAQLLLFEGGAPHDLVRGDPTSTHAIGIELRGQTSLCGFPKKQFGFEFRDALGEDLEVSILGMPAEADWVLNGAYRDSTGLRNHVGYQLAAEISAWAPRTVQVEVFLNQSGEDLEQGDYLGLFTLIEKVEQGAKRVDIEPLQSDDNSLPELAGGYIIEMTSGKSILPGEKWFCGPESFKHFLYVYPRGVEITDSQQEWIQDHVAEIERAIYRGNLGRASELLDMDALIDFALLNEHLRNADGFRRSTFLHKTRDGVFTMGPVWDLDYSAGYRKDSTIEGWSLTSQVWIGELLQHQEFRDRYLERYAELRTTTLAEDHVDELLQVAFEQCKDAGARDLDRWEELPEPDAVSVPGAYPPTHEGEVDRLRAWLIERGRWLDDHSDALEG